jgi:hypothetical protein
MHQEQPSAASKDLITAGTFRLTMWLILSYFGLRLLFFALNISSFVPPDEVTHAGLSKVFSKVFLLPDNSPESYEYGLATNIPWLYYWTMGKLLHLNFLGLPDLTFLRIVNIPIAFGTVYYIRRLLLLITGDRLTQLLLLVVLTNIPMFSLLSASVSYDNLTNLLAAMSIYYMMAYFRHGSGNLFLAALVCQLAGALTKTTFLPLALVLDLLLLVHEFKNLKNIPAASAAFLRTQGRRILLPALLIVFGIFLNLQLYGGNYLHYHALAPSMETVVSPDAAMENRIGARERIFALYTQGKISYMEALQLTGTIKHPGDKSDTFYLLMNYENLKQNPALWMGPLQYTFAWFQEMTGTIMGIKGHLSMFKPSAYLMPLYLVMALALAGFALRYRPKQSTWMPASLAVTACFYAAFLLVKINYFAYSYYGVIGITLQGRYLFPVLGPLCVLGCHYLLQLPRWYKLRLGLAAATAALFVCYDFPWFLAHATPQWYSWLPG